MPDRPIPLYDLVISPAAKRRVRDVLQSGWISSGPVVDELETTLSMSLDLAHVAAVSSATAGLELALRACGIGRGDEVIAPALTFVATVEAIRRTGATPVLVDVNPDTWTICPEEVGRAVTDSTRAILSVDYAGMPADYSELRRLARQHRLRIIADASHAIGALWNDKSLVHAVDVAVFSLHATKNLTAGEGGVVASRQPRLINAVRILARHGMTTTAHQRRRGAGAYDIPEAGLKANLSDLLAALALGQLERFSTDQNNRRRLVERYRMGLAAQARPIIMQAATPHALSGDHLMVVRLVDARRAQRDRVRERLRGEGIETGLHYRPVHTFGAYRPLAHDRLRHTALLADQFITLPLYSGLSGRAVDRVVASLGRAYERYCPAGHHRSS